MYFQRDVIENKMNSAGNRKQPFLFGIDFEMNEGFFIINPLSQSDILFDVNGIGNKNFIGTQQTRQLSDFQFDISPEDLTTYKERFKTIMNGLRRGETYLTNLTIETPVRTPLTLKEIFLLSKSPYSLMIPDKFVCFSPECFIKIINGKIYTYPMKGTIDAMIHDAEKTVMNDEKEKAEHNTIVDLLRNDLSRVAKDVHVRRFRYIDELHTNKGVILQVSSEIEGTLTNEFLSEIGTIVFSLLPAGSVSGAPKEATLKLISKAENSPRGYYTGVAGYFDGSNLDSFVLIRFIEQSEKGLVFRSGGGITARSDMKKEYLESLQKVYLPL